MFVGRSLCERRRVPEHTAKEVCHLVLLGDSMVSSKQINPLSAQRCPGLLLSNGYLRGLYRVRQQAIYTLAAVGDPRRRGLSATPELVTKDIWRGISRSLDLEIAQVGTPPL